MSNFFYDAKKIQNWHKGSKIEVNIFRALLKFQAFFDEKFKYRINT